MLPWWFWMGLLGVGIFVEGLRYYALQREEEWLLQTWANQPGLLQPLAAYILKPR